jgi:hypothetical protein
VTRKVPAVHGIAARRAAVGRGTRPLVARAVGRANMIRGRERRIDGRIARHDPGSGHHPQLAIDLRARRRQRGLARATLGPEVLAHRSAREVDDPHLRGFRCELDVEVERRPVVTTRRRPLSITNRWFDRFPSRRVGPHTCRDIPAAAIGTAGCHSVAPGPAQVGARSRRSRLTLPAVSNAGRSTGRTGRFLRRTGRRARIGTATGWHGGQRARESQESSESLHGYY